ncbi:hypothetical protein BDY19DRAFT_905095 [Irpex rosettiformis]|uniref:Uncharacterized protein n=1 Tax=Irpex rosettiformis TaxID=378272 RepID=A0ACB8U9J8_9APHY|nr:hypothetical protein BDY19DRAFT_905095 [Irpex rosettiformis]
MLLPTKSTTAGVLATLIVLVAQAKSRPIPDPGISPYIYYSSDDGYRELDVFGLNSFDRPGSFGIDGYLDLSPGHIEFAFSASFLDCGVSEGSSAYLNEAKTHNPSTLSRVSSCKAEA